MPHSSKPQDAAVFLEFKALKFLESRRIGFNEKNLTHWKQMLPNVTITLNATTSSPSPSRCFVLSTNHR